MDNEKVVETFSDAVESARKEALDSGSLSLARLDWRIARIEAAHAREIESLRQRAEAAEAKLSETLPCDAPNICKPPRTVSAKSHV